MTLLTKVETGKLVHLKRNTFLGACVFAEICSTARLAQHRSNTGFAQVVKLLRKAGLMCLEVARVHDRHGFADQRLLRDAAITCMEARVAHSKLSKPILDEKWISVVRIVENGWKLWLRK
jgi:hypothetical protein